MPKYFSTIIFFILCVFSSNAQTTAANDPSSEIKSLRDMYSKVFLKMTGEREALFSQSPIHYRKNGAWEEINTMLVSTNDGYKNESNVFQSYFPNSVGSSGKIKLIAEGAHEIFIHSEKKLVLMNDQTGLETLSGNSNNSIAVVTGNTITYPDVYANISDEYTVLNGEIKNNILLNAVPAELDNISTGYFGFQEKLQLPAGWKIISQDSSSLLIVDAAGKYVLTIPEPVIFDSNGLNYDGSYPVKSKYLLDKLNDDWIITTLVPVQWLKDENTKYPVTIDPTVTIAGTTGGWQSPNNFVDNPSFVFIGVCCSNLTHRAWIKFNISSIAATSCITGVELQCNVTSVANTTPELVWINDVTGTFGPYGAINAAAYNDFGTGNYTSFTINGTGLYGYYNLGASASALLQSQLPGGWFQVALQFNNEPSTNYKIITATSSNLRVTYSAPPCLVLPIELLSFDGKCGNGQVNLNWSTASQNNNDYFTIERSNDGFSYEEVGKVDGAGNSSQTINYSFADERPLDGTSYYNLKQTDFNGHTESIGVVAVRCDDLREITISPNPGEGVFSITGAEENSEIIVLDILGKIVFRSKTAGKRFVIDISNQPNGIYFVKAGTEHGITLKNL